jgi:16S rRNA (uracil1498-N3)-methyltransferase
VNIFIAHITVPNAELTEEESWHCAKVLRYKPGTPVKLIDGNGNFYDAELSAVSEKRCTAVITAGPHVQPARGYYLHVAIAPTKQIDRIEWMLEKAVEIGIDELSFVYCHNSERTSIKIERMRKIAESAVKQSLQARIPKLNEGISFKNFISSCDGGQKMIAHCEPGNKRTIKQIEFKSAKTVVLIGPEGDFSPREIEEAQAENFIPLSLGDNRLRTETAGLYVCQAAALLS